MKRLNVGLSNRSWLLLHNFVVVVVWVVGTSVISPKIGGEVSVRLSKGAESCFKEVSLRTRMAAGLGVAIAKSRELQKFLWGHGRDDSGTTGRGNETHSNTSAFTGKFGANGMRRVESRSPISQPDGDEGHFCGFDGAFNRICDFGGCLPSQTDEAFSVSDGDERFKSRPLTGGRLLLNGHDLHDLVLQFSLTGRSPKKMLNNIILFNTQGKSVDQSEIQNLSGFH